MNKQSVLAQAAVVVILLCAAYLGYAYWQDQKLKAFYAVYNTPLSLNSRVGDVAASFRNAPAVICAVSGDGFNAAYITTLHFAGGNVRVDARRTQYPPHHVIYTPQGFYAWFDGSDTVYFADADMPVEKAAFPPDGAAFGDFASTAETCRLWVSPDMTLFDTPEGARIRSINDIL